MNRGANWKPVGIAVLLGCIVTAVLSVLENHFKAGSVPDLTCGLLMSPGKLITTPFHDRGSASPEFLWRSRIAEAAVLSALLWLGFRFRRRFSGSVNK